MTDREAIDVLFNEWKCIDRNDGIHCDRKCESCDLVMDVWIIREAFNMAISALQAQEAKDSTEGSEELKQEVKNSNKSSLTQKKLDTIQAQDVPDTNVGKMDGDELNEAIRHCDEIVQDITWFCNSPSKYIEQRRHESAVKLRQLASWLRELKELSKNSPKLDKENGDLQPTCNQLATDTISRQDAIDAVRKCSVKEVTPAFMLVDKAEVMTELMMLPSAQPELATYYISKQSVIDAITDENIIRNMDSVMDSEMHRVKRSVHRIIASIPSAQPGSEERKAESAQNVPIEDLISRKAAIDAISNWLYDTQTTETSDEVLLKLPSAQPEREKGRWTKDCACEICGFKPWYERDIHTLSFCPNCGADMRGDDHDQSK